MNWLQIRLFGPYFSSFSTNSYGYYSQNVSHPEIYKIPKNCGVTHYQCVTPTSSVILMPAFLQVILIIPFVRDHLAVINLKDPVHQ